MRWVYASSAIPVYDGFMLTNIIHSRLPSLVPPIFLPLLPPPSLPLCSPEDFRLRFKPLTTHGEAGFFFFFFLKWHYFCSKKNTFTRHLFKHDNAKYDTYTCCY